LIPGGKKSLWCFIFGRRGTLLYREKGAPLFCLHSGGAKVYIFPPKKVDLPKKGASKKTKRERVLVKKQRP